MRRIERDHGQIRRIAPVRRRKPFASSNPFDDEPHPAVNSDPDLALAYSDGYVSVEISHDALDAYMEMTGEVPVPIAWDPRTGDRHVYDALHAVRVVYDAASTVREVSTRSHDGLFIRLNFTER
jgi:hypothetical protein